MKRPKAIFVITFTVLINIALIFSLYKVWEGELNAIWVPSFLALIPIAGFFFTAFLIDLSQTRKFLWGIWPPLVLGFIIVLSIYISSGDFNPVPIIIAFVGLVGWSYHIFWYSRYINRDKNRFMVGERLPSFPLLNVEEETIYSTELLNRPTIFLFYRGNWCAFCMTQIKELAKKFHEIENRGAQLVLVSSQIEEKHKELADSLNISAHFMRDKYLVASRKLGIIHEGGTPLGLEFQGYDQDTTLPTLILTDQQGVIRFLDVADNYKIRPEPDTYLSLLDTISVN